MAGTILSYCINKHMTKNSNAESLLKYYIVCKGLIFEWDIATLKNTPVFILRNHLSSSACIGVFSKINGTVLCDYLFTVTD